MSNKAEINTVSADFSGARIVTSRRMLTFGGTAAAVAGLISATPAAHADMALLADSRAFISAMNATAPIASTMADPGGDAEIVRMADVIMTDHAISMQLSDEADASPTRKRRAEIEKQQRAITEQNLDLRFRLVTMPATTLAGLRAKARVVHEFNGCFDGYADGDEDDALAWSLASDLLGRPCILRDEAKNPRYVPAQLPTFEEQPPIWQRDAADLSAHLAQAEADYALLGVCEELQHEDPEMVEQGWLETPEEYAAFEAQLEAVHARFAAVENALRGQRLKLGIARYRAFAPPISDDEV